jgi:hypothetical protein
VRSAAAAAAAAAAARLTAYPLVAGERLLETDQFVLIERALAEPVPVDHCGHARAAGQEVGEREEEVAAARELDVVKSGAVGVVAAPDGWAGGLWQRSSGGHRNSSEQYCNSHGGDGHQHRWGGPQQHYYSSHSQRRQLSLCAGEKGSQIKGQHVRAKIIVRPIYIMSRPV